tara:strand:- start:1079 stop:2263 length:1185 start_codon:yes stop_codon:yes gene_type:complete
MVKFKNKLVSVQLLLVFLIPITPHLEITNNIQLDDIPIFLFFLIFVINVFTKNINNLFFKETLPFIYFIIYITAQNFIINSELLYSENLRYLFYLVIFITILNDYSSKFVKDLYFYLVLFLSSFSILFYFFELNLGTDSYNYWNIGFNQNDWAFTNGRMNGFQAGGPNAFGGLIASLTLFCSCSYKGFNQNLLIAVGTLGCFFTYSRGAFVILIFFLLIYLILSKNIQTSLVLLSTFILILNFGLVERFSSDVENQGIEDRVEWQQASLSSISERSFINNLFGLGHGNIGIVDDEVGNLDNFSEDSRPTGPHNSFLYMIMKYGFFGLFLFLNVFIRLFFKFLKDFKSNLQDPMYLFLGSFVALSFTGDFIQNHSISVLFFLTFFILEKNKKNVE